MAVLLAKIWAPKHTRNIRTEKYDKGSLSLYHRKHNWRWLLAVVLHHRLCKWRSRFTTFFLRIFPATIGEIGGRQGVSEFRRLYKYRAVGLLLILGKIVDLDISCRRLLYAHTCPYCNQPGDQTGMDQKNRRMSEILLRLSSLLLVGGYLYYHQVSVLNITRGYKPMFWVS
jgi:hypothetical protein